MAGAYGLIEVTGVVAAIDCLDAMTKAASVELCTWERKLGGRLCTLIVEGDVSDVKASIEAAKAISKENNHNVASWGVIPAPCMETRKMVAMSAERLGKVLDEETGDIYLPEA